MTLKKRGDSVKRTRRDPCSDRSGRLSPVGGGAWTVTASARSLAAHADPRGSGGQAYLTIWTALTRRTVLGLVSVSAPPGVSRERAKPGELGACGRARRRSGHAAALAAPSAPADHSATRTGPGACGCAGRGRGGGGRARHGHGPRPSPPFGPRTEPWPTTVAAATSTTTGTLPPSATSSTACSDNCSTASSDANCSMRTPHSQLL